MNFDWKDLAFGSKKQLRELQATFIAPSRKISKNRFTELVKEYLPKGNIVLGVAKEKYIDGFSGQKQFQTLAVKDVQTILDKVNKSDSKFKIYTIAIAQKDVKHMLNKIKFSSAVFINGSWKQAFHTRDEFYTLAQSNIPYCLVSPFTDSTEAKEYAKSHTENLVFKPGKYDEQHMLSLAEASATLSYDYVFQTGVVLGKKTGNAYTYMAHAFNKVVPYQTYAMHHGSLREKNFSPANDLNFYDTIHAETALLLEALTKKISLKGTTLFINLLPCPTCARMLSETNIAELVYSIDHSDGYAVKLLEASGKKVRRVL